MKGLMGGGVDDSAAKALKAEQEREAALKREQENKEKEDQLAYASGLRTSRSLLSTVKTGYPVG